MQMSPAGLWREILLYRLQTQLFPQRCQAFSVHLRQHSLLQNPTVLLEGPACEDVHGRTQCHPSVSPTHHFLSYVLTVLSTCLWFLLDYITGMCPGTSMKQYRGSSTSQGTEIWSIFWTWPTKRVSQSSCARDRTSVQNGKW